MNLHRSLLTASLALTLPAVAMASGPTAEELLERADDMHRGESSHAMMEMTVKTKRWTRSLTMEAWSEGEEKFLVVIRAPAKEAGMATLKVEDNIWNYLPKVDRTMKVPASLMGGSWMGSHFTNDDLVKSSRMAEDYTFEITERPADGDDRYVVECTPKPDAPVVWGKVIVEFNQEQLPVEIGYWDEKENLKRTMTFGDYKDVGGVKVAGRMRMDPKDESGEFTQVVYKDLSFDVDLPPDTFTLQGLKR